MNHELQNNSPYSLCAQYDRCNISLIEYSIFNNPNKIWLEYVCYKTVRTWYPLIITRHSELNENYN